MGEFWTDPRVIIAILAIVNTIVVALLSQWWRHRRALTCEVVSDYPLLSLREELKKRVQVTFDGKSVENVHLVVLKVSNSGRVPIEDKDFVVPVSFNIGEKTEILTTPAATTRPVDLPVKLVTEGTSVSVEPLLLNRGDSITIVLLASKLDTRITIAGRVKGIAQLTKHTPGKFARFLGEALKDHGFELAVLLIVLPSLVSNMLSGVLGVLGTYLALPLVSILALGAFYVAYRVGERYRRGRHR